MREPSGFGGENERPRHSTQKPQSTQSKSTFSAVSAGSALIVGVLLFLLLPVAPFASSGQLTGHARTALALVEDLRSRHSIVDLGADDFIIQEGGESREILSVRVADYPVVLMVDTTGPDEDLPVVRKAARQFIEHLGAERTVAFGTFGESPKLLAGFDSERADLMKQVDEMAAATSSGGSLLGAAGFAAETLAPLRPLFSAIVLLSATQNTAPASADPHEGPAARERSGAEGPRERPSRGGAPNAAAALESPGVGQSPTLDATARVVASGAMVHIIASTAPPPTGGTAARAAALRALAEQTRGEFVTIYTAASYQAALDQIAARMASELLIEYLVPNESKATDVKVGVRLPGARVRGLGVR
jgi:hypothetical protein